MRILDLPHFQRFQGDRSVKVLRHTDSDLDLWRLRAAGTFDDFQDGQAWDVFGSAQHVISFIAERHRYAKFVGVWEVLAKTKKPGGGFRYKTREIQGFEDLHSRLVVQWGEGTRSWAQWLHRQGNKEVVELLPPNYVMEFPGFYNFTLAYDQLAEMIAYPDSNREWQRMLSSVSGVYLILDTRSGKQYVGSAYGAGGIWGRWRSYVKAPSGGNAQMRDLLSADPTSHRHFQFSIVRVLEPSSTKDEVIAQEALTKRKLGSRAFGLNSN